MFDSSQSAVPCLSFNASLNFPLTFQDLRTCQKKDPELVNIIEKLANRVPNGKYFTNMEECFIADLDAMVRVRLWCQRPWCPRFSAIITTLPEAAI
jgi:hypothetical protein